MIGWRMLFGSCFFFFNDTATTEIYTLSLHDALPIYGTETKHCRGTFIVEDTPTQAVLVTTDLVVEESTVDDGEFAFVRSEEHTSELQSPCNLVCRLLLEKKKYSTPISTTMSSLQSLR